MWVDKCDGTFNLFCFITVLQYGSFKFFFFLLLLENCHIAWPSSVVSLKFATHFNIDISFYVTYKFSCTSSFIPSNYLHFSAEYICLSGLPVVCHKLVCAIEGFCDRCFFLTSFKSRWRRSTVLVIFALNLFHPKPILWLGMREDLALCACLKDQVKQPRDAYLTYPSIFLPPVAAQRASHVIRAVVKKEG